MTFKAKATAKATGVITAMMLSAGFVFGGAGAANAMGPMVEAMDQDVSHRKSWLAKTVGWLSIVPTAI